MVVEGSIESGESLILHMVTIVPHIVCKKVTLIFSFSDVKVVVMSGGQVLLNWRGAVKEKPGGMVVVEGHLIAKVDGEDPDGDGRDACFESGVKVTVLDIELMDGCDRYVDKFCWISSYDFEFVVHNSAFVSSKEIGVVGSVDCWMSIVYSFPLVTSLRWVG